MAHADISRVAQSALGDNIQASYGYHTWYPAGAALGVELALKPAGR